jgi:hypothetical protein
MSFCRFVVLNYVGLLTPHHSFAAVHHQCTSFAPRDNMKVLSRVFAFFLGFGGDVVSAVAVQRSSDMLDYILRYGSELYCGVTGTQTEVALPIVPCLTNAPIAGLRVPSPAQRITNTPVLLLGGAMTLFASVIGVMYVVLHRRARELQQRLAQLEAAAVFELVKLLLSERGALVQRLSQLETTNSNAAAERDALMQRVAELQPTKTIAAVKDATLAEGLIELQEHGCRCSSRTRRAGAARCAAGGRRGCSPQPV